ncbi:hypothetical protein QYE76_043851 [Lolium multiflorum]|uniref:Uncharacterized protein n=1 Tax=Lolium multiflorum TaxID=4521 RepID=A0AAD8TJV6_LOLMU|nr:hypothetical protein QYE76_043851 [Lolium multiflorum]
MPGIGAPDFSSVPAGRTGGDRYISHVCHFVPTPNALLSKHGCSCQLGHLDAARSVFEDMSSDCGFTAVARVVRKYATGANSDLALKVFEAMLRLAYLPTLPAAKAVVPVLSAETGNMIENVITDDNPLFVRGGWGPGGQSTNHVTTMNRLLASKAYDVFRDEHTFGCKTLLGCGPVGMAAVTDLAFPDAAVQEGGGHGAEMPAAASLVYGSIEIGPDLRLDGCGFFVLWLLSLLRRR